jgi:CRISPR-associated endonuclease/helicase Cas3
MQYFWAKTTKDGQPGISVRDHCLNVGCVAQELAASSPLGLPERSLAVWLAACHDIGKIGPGFQQKCERWLVGQGLAAEARTMGWVRAERDHSKVSQFTLQHLLRQQFGLRESDAAFWAATAGMHHGTPHWRGEWKAAAGIPADDEWEHRRADLVAELSALVGAPGHPPQVELEDMSRLWWTAGLVTVADWIGSDEDFFCPGRGDGPAEPGRARAAARRALAQIGTDAPGLAPGRSFHDLFGFEPNELQLAALRVIQRPGVYVIEAPMGMGKTEAALAAAYQLISLGRARGLYFALPTQATSNRVHERVTEFLRRAQAGTPRLIHSGSWLLDKGIRFPSFEASQPDDQRRTARDWFASSKRALIAPFGVGTVDQALMGVIAVKHFFVRHFALAGKVVVLDEVHSYDVFTGTLIEALIDALVKLRCTVIILSATLTAERREKLLSLAGPDRPEQARLSAACRGEPFPLITGVVEGKPILPCSVAARPAKPPVAVRFRGGADLLGEAVLAARSGACVLWICNTVECALATHLALRAERREGDPPVGLLHARFPFYRRQELEEDWMRKLGKDRRYRPRGCLLVSTQIVEQSVDLDADLLVTELAPTDMLFQRLGRLWRHHKESDPPRPHPRPEVWIIQEAVALEALRSEPDARLLRNSLGKKARLYAPYVLLRTLEQWHDKTRVHLPGDIRAWLEATYQPRAEEGHPGWKQLLADLELERRRHVGQAETSENVWNLPALQDEEGIGTRLNECPTLPLVLARSVDDKTVTPLDGPPIPVQAARFDYATARALHRNLVKAPAWWFAKKGRCLQSVPASVAAMVSLHVHGPAEMGVVNGTTITAQSLGEGATLDFDPDRGLLLRPGTGGDDYQDESYD